MRYKSIFLLAIALLLVCCSTAKKTVVPSGNEGVVEKSTTGITTVEKQQTGILNQADILKQTKIAIADSAFVNLKDYSKDFIYDMKYASQDNFLKAKVYDCAECYLRLKTVRALVQANEKFIKRGYRIKLFDCYRPLDIQKKMWTIVSNPIYVADPRKGSIHNRGGAVDITLVDSLGKELDMGTAFDFFGIAASHDYENLSEEVKSNRKLLRNIMTRSGFKIFDSEWWHYNLKNSNKDKLSNFKWDCP